MNLANSVDPRRIFDGVPIRQVRNKDGFESASSTVSSRSTNESVPAGSKSKDKPKAKPKARASAAADKENAPAPAAPRLDRAKTRSSAALCMGAAAQKDKALAPPRSVRPAASAVFRAKENKDKENRAPSLRRSASSVRVERKPLGPRRQSPPASPVVKPQRSGASAGSDKVRGRPALGDRTRANVNEEGENAAANTSGDSVRDRMREWERERQRLRELARLEELRREEEAEEEERRREEELEEEMRRDIERQRLLEEELEREMEAERQRILVAVRESQRRKDAEALLEKEREERERDVFREQQYPRVSTRRFSLGSTPSDTHPPTPLSPLIEGE